MGDPHRHICWVWGSLQSLVVVVGVGLVVGVGGCRIEGHQQQVVGVVVVVVGTHRAHRVPHLL